MKNALKEYILEILEKNDRDVKKMTVREIDDICSACIDRINRIREILNKYYCYDWYSGWGSAYSEDSVLDGLIQIKNTSLIFHFHTNIPGGYEEQGHIEMPFEWLDDDYFPYYENGLKMMRLNNLRTKIKETENLLADLKADLKKLEENL